MGSDMWLFKSYSDEADIEAVTSVLERDTWWTKGPEIDEFESKIAERTDREYGIAVNSGTSALFAMLRAYNVEGGEVIIPSFTFPATANAVVEAGAKPVFADIERDSLALSVESIEKKITSETRAVMPIHFSGDIARDIFEIRQLCNQCDIPLLEDACHSLGATYKNTPVGAFGEAASFSFCFNKIITTAEGGMIVTDSPKVKKELELIRSHGRAEDHTYVTHGQNLRLSSMAAALGVSQFSKMDDFIETRQKLANYLTNQLNGIEEVYTPPSPPDRNRVYFLYVIQFEDPSIQAELANHLKKRGIPTDVTYEPVHLKKYYQATWNTGPGDLPITEDVSKKILTLPFHLKLEKSDLDRIADEIAKFFKNDRS